MSPDGSFLAIGEESNSWGDAAPPAAIRVWSLQKMGPATILPGHQGRIHSLAFSPNGKLLASVGDDALIKWFDLAAATEKGRASGPSRKNYCAVFGPDGKSLYTCGGDNDILCWDLVQGREKAKLKGHASPVLRLLISPDGKTLASCDDKTLMLWDLDTGGLRSTMGGVRSLYAMAFSPDGATITVTGNGQNIGFWDVMTGKSQRTARGELLAFAPDGKGVATVVRKETVSLWDAATGRAVGTLNGDQPAFSHDGKMIATTSAGGTVTVWNRETLVPLTTIAADAQFVLRMGFAPRGEALLTQGAENDVKLWDRSTGNLQFGTKPDFERLLTWRFSPDGRVLALAGDPRKRDGPADIVLVDCERGKERGRLKGHTGAVYALEFSPNGKTLASGSYDFSVKLWDPVICQELTTLIGHRGTVFSLAFTRQGNLLASASHDGTVRLWAANIGSAPVVPRALTAKDALAQDKKMREAGVRK